MHFKYIQKYSKNRVWIESGKSFKKNFPNQTQKLMQVCAMHWYHGSIFMN